MAEVDHAAQLFIFIGEAVGFVDQQDGLAASITRNIAAGVMLAVGSGLGTSRPIARNSVLLPHRIVGEVIVSRGLWNAASCACAWSTHSAVCERGMVGQRHVAPDLLDQPAISSAPSTGSPHGSGSRRSSALPLAPSSVPALRAFQLFVERADAHACLSRALARS